MLLVVSSLDKQDLILGFLWLKEYNLEVNWEKGEAKIIYCFLRCNSCKDLQKARKMEKQTIAACQSEPFFWILKEDEEPDMTIEYARLGRELGDKVFLTCILLERFSSDIQATATTFQRLSKAFQKSTAVDKKPLLSEFKTVDSNYFLSFSLLIYHFPFLLSLFWELRVRVNMTSSSHTSHMTKVTVVCHMEKYRRF